MVIYRNALYHREVRVHTAGYRRSVAEETIWLAASDGVNLTSYVRVYLKSRFHLYKVLLQNVRILERHLFPPGRSAIEKEVLPPQIVATIDLVPSSSSSISSISFQKDKSALLSLLPLQLHPPNLNYVQILSENEFHMNCWSNPPRPHSRYRGFITNGGRGPRRTLFHSLSGHGNLFDYYTERNKGSHLIGQLGRI